MVDATENIIGHGIGQSLSPDLETGCPKLASVKFWGIQIFKGDHITQILTINMYEFIKVRLNISTYNVMGIIWR